MLVVLSLHPMASDLVWWVHGYNDGPQDPLLRQGRKRPTRLFPTKLSLVSWDEVASTSRDGPCGHRAVPLAIIQQIGVPRAYPACEKGEKLRVQTCADSLPREKSLERQIRMVHHFSSRSRGRDLGQSRPVGSMHAGVGGGTPCKVPADELGALTGQRNQGSIRPSQRVLVSIKYESCVLETMQRRRVMVMVRGVSSCQ
ncbi:hypothetical protein S40293_11214 [Stachybotrys chartarum IBT 40293]|nr:hypothetical protein S40293_11214 [Stachybotrys chartarum IBT 40293]